MFERWRQENFFKYMREEFLLDALVDYRIEPEDPTRSIPNPERRALDKEVRAARPTAASNWSPGGPMTTGPAPAPESWPKANATPCSHPQYRM
jgi:hypothetical protein